MAESSQGLHESGLSPETTDRHRAIVSLQEELEAIDWYDQRIEAAHDPELKEILAHNRDEEKEHAALVLEWLRRRDPQWDAQLRSKLLTEGNIAALAEAAVDAREAQSSPRASDGSLGIGSLRGNRHESPAA